MKIFTTIFGSKLYGTNTKNSDTDYESVYIPKASEDLFKSIPEVIHDEFLEDGKKVEENTSTLSFFLRQALAGQTKQFDMLFSSDKHWKLNTEEFNYLINNRKKFITKKISKFIGFAKNQAIKYSNKGNNLKLFEKFLEFTESFDENIFLDSVLPQLELLFSDNFKVIEKNHTKLLKIFVKEFPINTKLKYINKSLRSSITSYGKRAKESNINSGFDFKALSHAFRVCYQAKRLALYGEYSYPLPETDIIMEVKLGKYDTSKIFEDIENLANETSNIINSSNLPNEPDYDFFADYLIEMYKKS